MTRRRNNSRQPGCIQYPLFLIKIPAAVLLRHEPALQAVGQFGHGTLEVKQLLVEISTQTCQFILVAQVGGSDDFIIFVRPGLVVETWWQV